MIQTRFSFKKRTANNHKRKLQRREQKKMNEETSESDAPPAPPIAPATPTIVQKFLSAATIRELSVEVN